MSNGQNAIIARMGIDLNGLKGDLTAAEKLAVRAANNTKAQMDRIAKGKSGGGHGGGGTGGAARPIGDALNAVTGTSGGVAQMGMLTHSLGATAGMAAGGLVFAKVLHSIASGMIEVHDASNDLDKALGNKTQAWWEKIPGVPNSMKQGAQLGDRPVNGLEGMRQRRDELAEKSEKAQKSRGLWTSVATAIVGSRDSGLDRSIKLQQQADEERLRLDAAIAGIVLKETEAREILVRQSQHEGELAKLRVEREEKIASIRDAVGAGKMGVQEGHAREGQANADYDLAKETADLKARAFEREIALAHNLNEIRLAGNDEGVRSAGEKLAAAQGGLLDARTGEEKAAAKAKVDAAATELRFAEKTRDEQRRGQADAIGLANLRADADVKHLASLMAEDRLIQAKQNDARTTKDQQRDLAVEAAKNAEAQRAHVFAMGNTAFDTGSSLIGAGQGVGKREEMRVAAEQLALERSRLTHLQNSPEAGPQAVAAQQAKVAQMARSYSDAAYSIAQGNRGAKAQTAEMAMQLAHQDSLAAAVQQQVEYAEKIRDAQRDGNTELAAQLQKQKDIALHTSARNASEAKQDKNGLSLGQLAGMGGKEAHRARLIQRLEARADKVRPLGNVGNETGVQASDRLRNRANQMRQGLANRGVLKPGEAQRDQFKTALDGAQVLKDIKTNTDKLGVNL